MNIDNEKATEKNKKNQGNFFQNILSSLFKGSNPEAEKKKRLKAIAKNISKSKYHAFYKASSGELQAPFGKLIYDLYKVISPAQTLFKNTQNPALFKRQIINYLLTEKQSELLEQLDEQKILEVSRKMPIDQLKKDIEQKLQEFLGGFDEKKHLQADGLCKAFTLFQDFCNFDFYLILKKFDSNYKEYNFNAIPRLEKVNGEYVVNDIKDFLSAAYSITDDNIDWNSMFEMLKATQSRELVSVGNWKKIVAKIKNIQLSKSMDLIVQHISEDPKYVTEINYHYESLLEPYVETIENETRNLLSKIETEQKESKNSSLCIQIFGADNPQNIKYYVSSFNSVLEKKDLSLLEYTEPLNYLKTFLIDFVKKQIREYYDVIVIRGQWDAALSAPMSNAYQELLKISDLITVFDEEFSEEGPMGLKIKTLLPKTAHDAGAENIINRVISDANDTAKGYIIQATQNLITIGKTVKQLLEDYGLAKPVIVQNWRELEKFLDTPIKEFSVEIYKKIYLFVQLMQNYIK